MTAGYSGRTVEYFASASGPSMAIGSMDAIGAFLIWVAVPCIRKETTLNTVQ